MLSSLKNKFDHWVLSPVAYLGIPVKLLESITIKEDIANDVVNIGYMYKKLDIVHLGCDNHPMVMRRIKREARSVLEEILKRNPSILTEDFSDYTIPLEVFPALLFDQVYNLTESAGTDSFLFTLEEVIDRGLEGEYAREIDDTIKREPNDTTDSPEDSPELESASKHKMVFTNLKKIFTFIKAFVENRKGYYPSPTDMAKRIKDYPIPIIKGRKSKLSAKVVWDWSSRAEIGPEGKVIRTGRLRPRFLPSGKEISVSSLWTPEEEERFIDLDPTEPNHATYLQAYTARIAKFVDDMVGITALHDERKKYRAQKEVNPEAQITPPREEDTLLRYNEAKFTGATEDEISPDERIQKEIHNAIELSGPTDLGKELAAQFPDDKPIKIPAVWSDIQQAPMLPKALPKWGTKEWKDLLPSGDSLADFALQEETYEKIITAAGQIYNDIKAELTELESVARIRLRLLGIEETNASSENLGEIKSKIFKLKTRLKDIRYIPQYLESIPAKESLRHLKDLYDLVRHAYMNDINQQVKMFKEKRYKVTTESSGMSPEKIYMTIKQQACVEHGRRYDREQNVTPDEIANNSQGRKYVTYEIVLATATNKHFDNMVVYAEESSDARLNKQSPGGAEIRNNYRNDAEDADNRRKYNNIKDTIQAIDFNIARSAIEQSITSISTREGYGIATLPMLKQGPNQQVGVITIHMPDPKTGVRKNIEVVIRRRDDLPANIVTNLTDEDDEIAQVAIDRILERESLQWCERIMTKYDGRGIKVPFPPGGDMFNWRITPEGIINFSKKFPEDGIDGGPNFATYEISYTSLREGNPIRTITVETGLSKEELHGLNPKDVLEKRLMRIVKQQPDYNPGAEIGKAKLIKKISPLECLFNQLDYQTSLPIMRSRKTNAAREDDITTEYLWGIYLIPKDAIFDPNTTPPIGAKKLANGTIVPDDEPKTKSGRKAVSPLFGYRTHTDATIALIHNILELDGDLNTRNPERGVLKEPRSGMQMVEFNTNDGTKRIVLATYQNKKSFRSVVKLLTNEMPPNYELQDHISLWKTRLDPSDPTSPLVWKPGGRDKFINQKLKPTGLKKEDIEKAFRSTIRAIAGNVYRKFDLRDKEQAWDDVSQEANAIFWKIFENDNKRAIWAALVKNEETGEKKYKYYANIGTVGGLPDHNDLRKTIIAEWAANNLNYYKEAAAKAIQKMTLVENIDSVWIFSIPNTQKQFYFAPDEPQFIDTKSGKPTRDFIKAELRLHNVSDDKLDDYAEKMYQGMKPAKEMLRSKWELTKKSLSTGKGGGKTWSVYRSGDFTRNGVKKDVFIALPTNDKSDPAWETSVNIFASYLQNNSDISQPELDEAVEELAKSLKKTNPDFSRYVARTLRKELTKRFMAGGRGRITSHNPGGTWKTFLVNAPIARYDVYIFDFISIPNGVKYRWERNNVSGAGTIPEDHVKQAIESYATGEHLKTAFNQKEVPDDIQLLMRGVNCHVYQYRNEIQNDAGHSRDSYVDRLREVNILIARVLAAYSKQVEQEITKSGTLRYDPDMQLKTILKPYKGDPWTSTIENMSIKEYLDKSIYIDIIPIGKTVSGDVPDERETTISGSVRTSVPTPDKIAMTKEQAEYLLNNSGLTDEQIEIIKVKYNLDDEQSQIGFFRDLANQERNQEQEWVDKETGMRFPVAHNIYRDNTGLEFEIPVNMNDNVEMKKYIENDLNFTKNAQHIQVAAKEQFGQNISIDDVIDTLQVSNPKINQQWIPKLVEMAKKNQSRSTDDIAANLEFVGPAKPTHKEVGVVLQNKKFEYNGWECNIGKETFLVSLPQGVTPQDTQGRTLILKKLTDIANSSLPSERKTRTSGGIPVYKFIQPIVKQAMKAAPITSKKKPPEEPPEEPEEETVWKTEARKEPEDIYQDDWIAQFNAELSAGIERLALKIIPTLQRASTRIKKGDDENDEITVANILKQDIDEILDRLELIDIQGQPKDRDFTLSFSEDDYNQLRHSMSRLHELAKSQPEKREEHLENAKNIDNILDAIKTNRAFYDSGTGMYFASKDVGKIAKTIKNLPKIITYHCPKYDIDFYNPHDPEDITESLKREVDIGNNITITMLAEHWMEVKKAAEAEIDMYKKNVIAISAKEATTVQKKAYNVLITMTTNKIINAKWEEDAETDLYINATMTTKTAGLEVAEKIKIKSKSSLDISINRMAEEIHDRLHAHHQSVQQRDKVPPERAQQLVQQLRLGRNDSARATSLILDIGPSKVMLDAVEDMMRGADEFKNDTAMRLSDLDTKIMKILEDNDDRESIIEAFMKLFREQDKDKAYRIAFKIFNVYTVKKYGGSAGGGSVRERLWKKIDDSNTNTRTGLKSEQDDLETIEADRQYVYKPGSIYNMKYALLSPKAQYSLERSTAEADAIASGHKQFPNPGGNNITSESIELPSTDDM